MSKYENNITVKNPLFMELPKITVSLESSGTLYRFHGSYDGTHALPAKLLKLMENEKTFEKEADKLNNE